MLMLLLVARVTSTRRAAVIGVAVTSEIYASLPPRHACGGLSNGAPNVIERNAMWNCGDHGIQSAADAVIRNNIIVGSATDGIAMQPHQSGAPDNLMVLHNTILHASFG